MENTVYTLLYIFLTAFQCSNRQQVSATALNDSVPVMTSQFTDNNNENMTAVGYIISVTVLGNNREAMQTVQMSFLPPIKQYMQVQIRVNLIQKY